MAPPDCKITTMALFLYVLALIYFHADAAVNILGFKALRNCSVGVSTACLGIGRRVCCRMQPGVHSVSFFGLEDNWGNVYNVNFCGEPVLFTRRGPRAFCVGYESEIQSATYVEDHPPALLTNQDNGGLVELDSARGCNSTMLPNAVVYYSPDPSAGTWILKSDSDNVENMLKHVESLPDDQQLAWMKNAGAELNPFLGEMETFDARAGTA